MSIQRLLVTKVFLSLLVCLQVLAQDESLPQADVLSEQVEAEQSEQDISNADNSLAEDGISQESNTEPSPEVFNPTEEILEDTAVSFPVDI